jgi:hypothetical protein
MGVGQAHDVGGRVPERMSDAAQEPPTLQAFNVSFANGLPLPWFHYQKSFPRHTFGAETAGTSDEPTRRGT